MATSPIYSWPEPDNTDLVKNGALAIRTLGNAIDTTMGTMVAKTIIDAKGDLIAGSAADTALRLAVGSNGETLVADSSTATGLKWQSDTKNTVIDAVGDLLVGTAADTLGRIAIGTNGQVLQSNGTTAIWATAASSIPVSATAEVTTAQGTTSSTYTDLATAGPAVTLTTGTKALVIVSSFINESSGSGGGNFYASFAVSGATTVAADDKNALAMYVDSGQGNAGRGRASSATLVTLTAGSNTFTTKYRNAAGSGTAFFVNRQIFVLNLA